MHRLRNFFAGRKRTRYSDVIKERFTLNSCDVYNDFSIKQYSSIGSDNGMSPNMRQAIIRTNDG